MNCILALSQVIVILNEGAMLTHSCKILCEHTRKKNPSFSGLDSNDSRFINYLGFLWILHRRGKDNLKKNKEKNPFCKGLAVYNINHDNTLLVKDWKYRSITHNKENRNNPSLPPQHNMLR